MKGQTTLDLFDFGLLFQALAQSLKVGTLRVRSGDSEKFVYLSRGRIEAIYTARSRFRIGDILFNSRAVEREDLELVLEEQEENDERLPLGEELLRRGLIDEATLEGAVRHQMMEELLEIFYWRKISYEFFLGPIEKALPHISRELVRVGGSHDVNDLLLGCLTIIDDIEKYEEATPCLADVYEVRESPAAGVDEHDLLALVDGRRDLSEILREARMNRFEAMEAFYRLRKGGAIRALNGRELEMLAEEGREVLPPEKIATLLTRARELGARSQDGALHAAAAAESLGDRSQAAERYRDYVTICLAEDDLEGAREGVARAVAARPDSVEMRDLQVQVLERSGCADEVSEALLELATLHRERAEHRLEARALAEVRRLRPDDAQSASLRSLALENAGDPRSAARAWVLAAEIRRRRGDPAGAEEALRDAVVCVPRSFRYRKLLVRFLAMVGRRDRASLEILELVDLIRERTRQRLHGTLRCLRAVERLVTETGTEETSGALALGGVFLDAGSPDEAAKVFLRAAEGLDAAGSLEKARNAFRRVLAIRPGDTRSAEALASVHAARGEVHHAVGELLAVAREAGVEQAEHVHGRILDLLPGTEESLVALARLAEDGGRRAEAAAFHARLGHLLRAAGRDDEAVHRYDRACELDPADRRHCRDLGALLSDVLMAETSSSSMLPMLSKLRERGEHLGVIGAGLRLLGRDGEGDEVRQALDAAYEALGREIRASRS